MISISSAPAGQAAVAQLGRDPVGELGVVQGRRGDVDGDGQIAARPVPLGRLVEGLLEHRGRQVLHEPGVLDQGQERVGEEQPAGRVLPAHQRLDARRPAGVPVDLGLVMEDQLAAADGRAQQLDGLEPVARGELVDLDAVREGPEPLGLGVVHRDVGLAQQRGQLRAAAGRTAMPMLTSTCTVTPSTTMASPIVLRTSSAIALAVGAVGGEDEGELVAAQPGHQVGPVGHEGAQPVADLRSISSPAWWPRLSLTSLNRSRSRRSSATEAVGSSAATVPGTTS